MDSLIVRNFGHIENGKLMIYDQDGMKRKVKDFQNERVTIEIHTRQGKVSQQLRRYYFGILLKELQRAFFSNGYEYDLDTLDHTFRMKALYHEVYNEEKDRMIKEPHSLKDQDTLVTVKMFAYYIEYIIRFAIVNLDWAIAFPNEILKRSDYTDKQFESIISQI